MPLGFQFLGQKMTIFSNFSILFKICLETIEIQYWSEFGVIWIIFGGFMAILVEHFSPFFIKANIKEFVILNFYKKCMQILNFDWNWLIFGRKHLWMVLQKRYLGKLLKKFFDPFLGLKSQKMTIFARFLSFSRFLGQKNHENLYFYKISKITFFWHPMRVVYMDLQLIWIKIGDLHKLLPKFRLKITFVFII